MLEKKTQQREGHPSTRSLPHHRVTPKSDTSPGKKQPLERGITHFLQIFDQFKPHIVWVIIVAAAIYDLFWPSTIVGLIEFVVLIAWAEGRISLLQVIGFLQGKLGLLSLQEGENADDLREEETTEYQDEPTVRDS